MSSNLILTEEFHLVRAVVPVADAFAGTVNSDVINMRDFSAVTFIQHVGVGATGSSTITIEACDDVTPTNTTAVAFTYREVTTGDTPGALTAAAAAGVVNTVGSNRLFIAEVKAEDIASTGYGYVRAVFVESVDSPVLGGVLAIGRSRTPQNVHLTAIT